MDRPTIEQMARDLLSQAVKDRVLTLDYRQWQDPNPQARSGGEIMGVVNLLAKILRDAEGGQCVPDHGEKVIIRGTLKRTADGLATIGLGQGMEEYQVVLPVKHVSQQKEPEAPCSPGPS